MKPQVLNMRRGMTLLELLIATAMMTTIIVAVVVLLRGGFSAWTAHEEDAKRIEAAHAVARHMVRQLRQADSVTAITAATNLSGSLSLAMPSGETVVWAHDAVADEVNYGVDTATELLADNIVELSFTAYEADGTTQTTTVADIQSVQCTVKVVLPRNGGGDRTVSSWGWIRSW